MDENVSKHPENQQNVAQNLLKSGNVLKIVLDGQYILFLEKIRQLRHQAWGMVVATQGVHFPIRESFPLCLPKHG